MHSNLGERERRSKSQWKVPIVGTKLNKEKSLKRKKKKEKKKKEKTFSKRGPQLQYGTYNWQLVTGNYNMAPLYWLLQLLSYCIVIILLSGGSAYYSQQDRGPLYCYRPPTLTTLLSTFNKTDDNHGDDVLFCFVLFCFDEMPL